MVIHGIGVTLVIVKKIYDEFINMIQFENIKCWDIQAPKEWLNNIKDLKINEDLK